MRIAFFFFCALFVLMFAACDDNKPNGTTDNDTTTPAVGSEGGPCYPNGTCNDGLQCLSDICVEMPDALNDETTADEDEIATEDAPDKTESVIPDDDQQLIEDDILPDSDTYVAKCGNDNIDDGETCELGDTIDCALVPDKNFASGTTASCNNSCTGWLDIVCTTCGNGAKDDGELCEKGTTLDCASIPGKSYETGTLATCNASCTGWNDKDVCTVETPITCNNGTFDDGSELCEAGFETSCADIPGMNYADSGNAVCNDTCTGWNDEVACTTCGNGVKDGGETCEKGTIIDCGSIAGKNYETGTDATCNDTCTGWNDAAVCTLKPIETCDNGTYDPGLEVCEKGLTTPCEEIPSANYAAVGTATCNDTCTGWNDATACTTCGNGAKDASEVCDGSATLSCATVFGNYTGDTACLDDCTGYDITDCTAATRTYTCTDKPATGTAWNTVSSYTQTWSGSAWLPVDDPTTEYNATASTTSCRYKCATNYTWNGTACAANTRTYTCSVKPASNTAWNTVSSYTQTWNGSEWMPVDDPLTEYNETGSATSCQYKCATNYTWNGSSCVAGTKTYTCNAKPATGTVWNTVSSYIQTWTGTTWNPADDAVTDYNVTGSATSCRYKCDINYTWSGSVCVANTRPYNCSVKPSIGTIWNTVSSYTQTWNGSEWMPVDDSTTEYNETGSATSCQFVCATNYNWTGTECEAATKNFSCNAIPTANGVYNTAPSYSQTWSGTAWEPADDAVTEYNATPSTTSCRFVCDAGYVWNSVTQTCPVADICSNGVVETGEECDTYDTTCNDISTAFNYGVAPCSELCDVLDTNLCMYKSSFAGLISSIDVDNNENVYIVKNLYPSQGIFLYKYNNAGSLVWNKSLQSVDEGGLYSPSYGAVDSQNKIYATSMIKAGTDQYTGVFLIKYNEDGSEAWHTMTGTGDSLDEEVSAITIDASDNIYVAGKYSSQSKIFVYMFNSSGTVLRKVYLDNLANHYADVAVDSAGLIYALGYNEQTCRMAIFDSNASPKCSYTWSTTTYSYQAITVDSNGNPYVAGVHELAVGREAVLTKMTAACEISSHIGWDSGRYLNSFSVAFDVTADSDNNFYMGGYTVVEGGNKDYFVAKWDVSGAMLWQYVDGEPAQEKLTTMALDNNKHLYIAGEEIPYTKINNN
ncbi:MAG TPA: hypothetical protein PKH10_03840 [bacterium]|nr:hypothetical protein [bacterium]